MAPTGCEELPLGAVPRSRRTAQSHVQPFVSARKALASALCTVQRVSNESPRRHTTTTIRTDRARNANATTPYALRPIPEPPSDHRTARHQFPDGDIRARRLPIVAHLYPTPRTSRLRGATAPRTYEATTRAPRHRQGRRHGAVGIPFRRHHSCRCRRRVPCLHRSPVCCPHAKDSVSIGIGILLVRPAASACVSARRSSFPASRCRRLVQRRDALKCRDYSRRVRRGGAEATRAERKTSWKNRRNARRFADPSDVLRISNGIASAGVVEARDPMLVQA